LHVKHDVMLFTAHLKKVTYIFCRLLSTNTFINKTIKFYRINLLKQYACGKCGESISVTIIGCREHGVIRFNAYSCERYSSSNGLCVIVQICDWY
jgi:hypothetical protein